MNEYIVISLVALIGSGLTLFSGFGLGTILLPVFGFFFPIDLAVALTGIVHFLNNVFKFFMLGKKADRSVLFSFGVPSVMAAFFGAYVLKYITNMPALLNYELLGMQLQILPVKFIIAIILFFFALYDILPSLKGLQFDKRYLPIGGVLSGFFGGLSGNQGALRSAFLIKTNLSKESFIATGVVIACFVDVTRLSVYFSRFSKVKDSLDLSLLVVATVAAFIGAFAGNKLIQKVTIELVQFIVAILLILFSVMLALGIV